MRQQLANNTDRIKDKATVQFTDCSTQKTLKLFAQIGLQKKIVAYI